MDKQGCIDLLEMLQNLLNGPECSIIKDSLCLILSRRDK